MLLSQFKQILTITLMENSKQILGRELKPFEIAHFYNLHEEKLTRIMHKAKHDMEMYVNEYLEDIK